MAVTAIPPEKSLDAEQAVLGSLLIDPEIAPALFASVKPEDFIYDRNQLIFETARKMFRKGEPLDAVTLFNALKSSSLTDMKTSDYLVGLMEITPTSANWRVYAESMREKSALWRIKCAAEELVNRAKSIDDCRQYAGNINALLNQRQTHKPYSITDIYTSFCDRQSQPPPEYFRYGIPELDKMMFTEPGDVVVIGGEPSSGKTAFALATAYHMGAQGRKVAVFSLETDIDKVSDRMVSRNIQLNFGDIKSRAYQNSESAWEKIAGAAHMFDARKNKFTLYTGHPTPLTLADIENLTRAYGYEAIFIDYIQKLFPTFTGTVRGGIREKITEISMELHSFAQSTKTTVFELAQLARQPKIGWTEPTMFDLKESGQLEQDADAVLLIYHPPKNDKYLDVKKNRYLKIAKNKEGETGTMILDFDGATQSFRFHKLDKEVMRNLSDAGRAAKARNRTDAQDTYYQPSFDDSDMPF